MEDSKETLANLSRAQAHSADATRTFAQRGEHHRQMGRYVEALADLDQAIELRPDYSWAIAHRAETFRLMGCYEQALTDFDCAIERMPDYAWALAHRGAIHRALRHNEQALTDFNQAIELKPHSVWPLINRGLTLLALRCYEKALTDFDHVAALDKTVISHWWPSERGLVLNFLGRYTEAIACCKTVLQQTPEDRIAHYSLIVAKTLSSGVNTTQSEIDEMQVVLQHAYQVATHSKERATILYQLGGLAALRGKNDQALNYLKATLPLNNEPIEQVRHDPAWDGLRANAGFQSLLSEAITVYRKRSFVDESRGG